MFQFCHFSGPLSQSKNSKKFESVFKISRKTFNYICSLVRDDMMARPSNFNDLKGRSLSLNDQVAVALRRLSSGESLSSIGESFGINQSTVSQVTLLGINPTQPDPKRSQIRSKQIR
jgi:hypothetical protein